MYKPILSILIATVLFISLTNAISFGENTPQRTRVIDRGVGEGVVTANCTVNKKLRSCQNIDNQLFCPNIKLCLNELTSYVADEYFVNVPSGIYQENDCPGTITLVPNNVIVLISVNGFSTFNCNKNQFLDMVFYNTTEFILDGFIINGGSSDIDGGCINIQDQSNSMESGVYIYNSAANNCVAKNNGGFLNAVNLNVVFIYNCTFIDNVSLKGSGGVVYTFGSELVLDYSYFNGNKALIGGVAFGSDIYVGNSPFIGNSAELYGGSLYSLNSIFVNTSAFANGFAGEAGGALYNYEGQIYVNLTTFYNNSAPIGGVVQGCNLTMENSEFDTNFASNSGGVISISYPQTTVSLSNCTFENSFSNYGGVIYADLVAINITNCKFLYNTAAIAGGSIYASNGEFSDQYISITESVFNNSLSYINGGALYLENINNQSFYLDLTKTVFNDNSASQYAGAIYFTQPPTKFIGGVFSNSKSSEPTSMTFYSLSLVTENVVNIVNNLAEYNIPTFKEQSFKYWKALGARGNCKNGVAVINQNGVILSCKRLTRPQPVLID